MGGAQRALFAACVLIAVGAGVGVSSASATGATSHRTGKSFGIKSLFGLGEATTTVRPAPKQIWKIHKYHGIELRPVLAPPTPAKEYGPPAETYGPPAETYGPPAETYGPVATKEEPSKGFKLPFKLDKLNIFKQKTPEIVTAAPEVYGPPVLPYSPPLEPYKPPSTSYGSPVTSYGTPAESYDTPVEPFYPPAQAYNKLPGTYPPAVEIATRPPPTEKYLQSIKTIKFPFKKFPKISTETKEPEPLEVYSPDGSSSNGLEGLDDLDTLAKLSSYLPEDADSKTTDAVSKLLEHVDLETILSVLEFLNSKNHGNEPIDISSLVALADYIPSLEKNQHHFDLGSLIKAIPDVSDHGKGHFAKVFPLSKKGHPKLIGVLAVLKGLKAAEIAALSHILGLGKKHHGIFGKLGAVGTTIAAVKAGKAATLGLIGASFAGVKGAIQKPFKHIGSKFFPGKDHGKFEIPSLLPVAVGSISSLGDKFKHIPENLLSKFGGSSHSEGPYPASGVPDLPSLPDFGLHLPKFPKISISGGYKLQKSSGAPYVRISYPKKSIETAPYPEPASVLPETDAASYSVPFIPATYSAPHQEVTSSSGFYPDPRNQPSTYSSASGTGSASIGSAEPDSHFVAPSPVYVAPKEVYEAPKPTYTAPEKVFEVPKQTFTAAHQSYEAPKPTYTTPQESHEAPKPTYTAPHQSYEVPKPTYTAPQQSYEVPKPTYTAPQQSYEAPKPIFVAPLNTYEVPKPTHTVPVKTYEVPEPAYNAPQPTYSVPKQQYQPQIRDSPQTPQYIRQTIKLNTWPPKKSYSAPAPYTEAPEQSYQLPSETHHAPQTGSQIRYGSKRPQPSFVSHSQAPKHSAQPEHHVESLHQAYLVPQASQEYQQVVKAPNKVSENYHSVKESRLPMTAFQARHTFEDYDEDVVYESENQKETQRSPLSPEETEEDSFETFLTPVDGEAQEDTYEQPRFDTQEFVEGQYVQKKKYHAKSSTQIEAEAKRWPNNHDQYYPGSLVSYAQIPQSSRYFSSQKNYGVYETDEEADAASEDSYHAASENQASVVAAPTQEAKSAPTEQASAEESQQTSDETKKASTEGSSRSEKQIKSSNFAPSSASGGFSPSSGPVVAGSNYSRVSFQRSSPSVNPDMQSESTIGDVVKTSGASSLPVTVAESMSKPMAGPRGMKDDADKTKL